MRRNPPIIITNFNPEKIIAEMVYDEIYEVYRVDVRLKKKGEGK